MRVICLTYFNTNTRQFVNAQTILLLTITLITLLKFLKCLVGGGGDKEGASKSVLYIRNAQLEK